MLHPHREQAHSYIALRQGEDRWLFK